jgi:hypothetical protein
MMRINFFEEYPSRETLEKARTLTHPATIYIGARSLPEFLEYKTMLAEIAPEMTAAYWPILEKSYWVSPFSYTHELIALRTELREYGGEKFPVLLDLEFPLLAEHRSLLLKNLTSFARNKNIIQSLLELPYPIYTAQDALQTTATPTILSFFGLNYSTNRYGHTPILMHYTSMAFKFWIPVMRYFLRRSTIKATLKKDAGVVALDVGVGCLATGAYEHEPIISPEELRTDLEFLKEIGVSTVTLFRLGGLTDEYVRVLSAFAG